MTAFLQYKALLKAETANLFGNKKLRGITKNATKKESPLKRLAYLAIMGVAAVLILFYLATLTVSLTLAAIKSGTQKDVLYFLFGVVQLIVLFFGVIGGVSMLYFSKDNALLSSLPIRPAVRFAVKFTMLYLGELTFSILISLPMMLTYGIVCSISNVGLPWNFFLYAVINIFLLPSFPLLLISVVSLPIMYLTNFFRRIPYGKHIGQFLMMIIGFGIYFAIVIGANMLAPEDGKEGEIFAALTSTISAVRKVFIFNFPMIEAMWGNHAAGYFFAYLAECVGLIGVGLGLSSLFYSRALQVVLESGNVATPKRKKGKAKENYAKSGFLKSFLLKEWKTILASPAMLLSIFSATVLMPLIGVIFGVVFGGMDDPEMEFSFQGILIPMMTMMGLVGCGMNMVSMIGISREGKTFLYMKSMPIPMNVLLMSKLMFSMIVSGICIILMEIAMPIAIHRFSPSVFFGNLVVFGSYSWGMNCIGLRSDLKKPNLNWNNINELTNNNRRTLKPALFGMAVSFFIFIVGIVLMLIESLPQELRFLLFYLVAAIPAIIVAVVGDRLLRRDAVKFFEAIGE